MNDRPLLLWLQLVMRKALPLEAIYADQLSRFEDLAGSGMTGTVHLPRRDGMRICQLHWN
jgi:hypothetical protein